METERPVPELVNSIRGRVVIPLSLAMIAGFFVGFALGAITWLAIDSSLRVVFGVVTLGFLATAAVVWWAEYRSVPLHEVTRTVAPEPMPEPEREPIIVRSYAEAPKDAATADLGRFLRDCLPQPSNRALRKRGWSELEISSLRDYLIEHGRATWIDDGDHKRGWKLL